MPYSGPAAPPTVETKVRPAVFSRLPGVAASRPSTETSDQSRVEVPTQEEPPGEAEEALGYHSSGRSVSFSHYGIGNDAVRAASRNRSDPISVQQVHPSTVHPGDHNRRPYGEHLCLRRLHQRLGEL